jgi:hypothetical protein
MNPLHNQGFSRALKLSDSQQPPVSRTHMQDLKDVTNNVHYENYRSRKLAAVTYNGVDNNRNKGQLTK